VNATGERREMSNLQLRVISAVVLAVAVLVLTWIGGLPFRLLCALIAAAMLFEWCSMARSESNRINHLVAAVALLVPMLAMVAGASAGIVLLGLAVGFGVTYGHAALTSADKWAPAGLVYAGLSGIAMAYLRGAEWAGLIAILFLFATVWATDILAYFVGRAVGGPKLAPSISPGKTRSGAVGGAVGGVLAALILMSAIGSGNLAGFAVIALLLSVISQAGDLFESWVKRRHGVKDSGNLIPGHGGVMDRVDGLVAAAIALYLIGAAIGGLDNPSLALFGTK
jgi:phosphatidate cytidylyltransferase